MTQAKKYEADVIVIGGGLAGLTAVYDLLDSDKKILLIDRDRSEKLGGLAKESFGGIMMVDTPEQKRSKIKDTPDLALSDWLSFAQFEEDAYWPRKWAEKYTHDSLDIYHWLTSKSVEFLPVVNWPERGLAQRGNSLARWHVAWGTGFGIVKAVVAHLEQHRNRKNLQIKFEHRVTELLYQGERVTGCHGTIENRTEEFVAEADIVIVAAGGICGGDLTRVRKHWYPEWGTPPKNLLNGSHQYADGTLHDAVKKVGGNLTHLEKQWHYAAGIPHPEPTRPNHGLSVVPPRSALWVNAHGKRIGSPPLMGYTDTRYLVEQICQQPGQYSWQIMNWKIAIKELAISGSEHMTAFRDKSKIKLALNLIFGNKKLVNRMLDSSPDFIAADSLPELVRKMNDLDNPYQVDGDLLSSEINQFDAEIDRGVNTFTDFQLKQIALSREYRGDRLRLCKFQKIDDPKARPLIAIREFIITRKSLGGIQTDLQSRVLNETGNPIQGLYAVGEAAGFGGGGIHGLRSLEGTFLGSCILTGSAAAKHIRSGS